ncbi:uncharacterized protein HMPREF1541_08528 [Cyphellophora europaea CBS 101466]|uniref:Uncharacterized protein n=1 Tax=Cyphellophora europaea (strain CBS 101466) TaxID=1220924 RepID=W2RIE3_CYPE1|nr:uncharacterized protein HMPREF1541_08528 [Cyphellophora europaea CBS 101466]ETN36251.1 hypothetical protein HMPREF1541_08528 [Cyphellophora europaea CBS 101466]
MAMRCHSSEHHNEPTPVASATRASLDWPICTAINSCTQIHHPNYSGVTHATSHSSGKMSIKDINVESMGLARPIVGPAGRNLASAASATSSNAVERFRVPPVRTEMCLANTILL